MNLHSIISNAVKPDESKIDGLPPKPETEDTNTKHSVSTSLPDAQKEEAEGKEDYRRLRHTQWLKNSFTPVVLTELLTERNRLNNHAIQLAAVYHTHNNHQQIINNLVRVAQLDIILQAYARIPTNNNDANNPDIYASADGAS